MARHIRAGNNEKERRARHKHGEAVNTLGHFQLPIFPTAFGLRLLVFENPLSQRPKTKVPRPNAFAALEIRSLRPPATNSAVPTRSRQTRNQPYLLRSLQPSL